MHISEFKRNPAEAVRTAIPRHVAVLNRKRLEFYAIDPDIFRAMVDLLGEEQRRTLIEKVQAVEAAQMPQIN
jgi:hypothetical protein